MQEGCYRQSPVQTKVCIEIIMGILDLLFQQLWRRQQIDYATLEKIAFAICALLFFKKHKVHAITLFNV